MRKRLPALGFTLVELVIVIVILSVLTATVLPRFVNLEEKAREAVLKGALTSLQSAARIGNVYSRTEDADSAGDIAVSINGTDIDIYMVRGYPVARPAGNGTTFLGIEELMEIDPDVDVAYNGGTVGTSTTDNNRTNAQDDTLILFSGDLCVSYQPPQAGQTDPNYSAGVLSYDATNQTCS